MANFRVLEPAPTLPENLDGAGFAQFAILHSAIL